MDTAQIKKAARRRRYYLKNKAKILSKQAEWRLNNKPELREIRNRWRRSEAGREAAKKYRLKRLSLRPELVIKARIKSRIFMALKSGNKKWWSTMEALGCTFPELKSHLEKLFLPGMTWENKHLWHIDHVRPCASFNLLDPEQQKCCFSYTNLQPLWAKDNLQKSCQWP